MGEQGQSGGTGSRFAAIVTILAGVSALVATLLTFISVWLQSKNYRKPLLQRYVIRILFMVPIYSAASWASLTSLRVAFWVDPLRDVYEAFTLYTFFQLLINFLGGERSLIIMMHGRQPVSHLWPLNHCLPKVDISDPHTFLAVKRSILQYAYIKPILSIAIIVLKSTNTYKEGYIGVTSGYLWSGIIYNLSITISLYALALFWVCMSADMQPFRPMPKFLCIKGIIFASYWQGFFLSILVWLGAITDASAGYTADNLAAAIQDALICFEMPLFALAHWYAFSWHDYADKTISDARMPVKYALRDAVGTRDLIEDAKETFYGTHYEYRHFDANDNVMAHEESSSRNARMKQGMRYERGGRGKYWLPEASVSNAKTPLLSQYVGSNARTMDPGSGTHRSATPSPQRPSSGDRTLSEPQEPTLDEEEERLYRKAREMEFGDWNYPVINTHFATERDRSSRDPNIVTASTNRSLLQPSKDKRSRRESRMKDIQTSVHQGQEDNSKASGQPSSAASSPASHSSQLVDLVVEDEQAEQIERVRARKEGSSAWNNAEQKHFVQTLPAEAPHAKVQHGSSNGPPTVSDDFAVGDDDEDNESDASTARGAENQQEHFNDDERQAWSKV